MRAFSHRNTGQLREAERDLEDARTSDASAVLPPMERYSHGVLRRFQGLDHDAVQCFLESAALARSQDQPEIEFYFQSLIATLDFARADSGLRMLEANFFGHGSLRLDGFEVMPSTKKSLGLIADLMLESETDRGRLAHLFLGKLGSERARKNLRQELYRISSSPLGVHLDLQGERVGLRAPCETDVQRFRTLLASGDFAAALAEYADRLALVGCDTVRALARG